MLFRKVSNLLNTDSLKVVSYGEPPFDPTVNSAQYTLVQTAAQNLHRRIKTFTVKDLPYLRLHIRQRHKLVPHSSAIKTKPLLRKSNYENKSHHIIQLKNKCIEHSLDSNRSVVVVIGVRITAVLLFFVMEVKLRLMWRLLLPVQVRVQ